MKRLLLPLALAASLVSGAAFAQNYGYGQERYNNAGYSQYEDGYDYAEVVRVDPIIDRVDRPVYRDECWQEPVTYREPDRYYRGGGSRDRAPAVLGGIIGGLVGNQFGSGSGRDAATLAGAALGYASVRDSQRYSGGGYYAGGREYTTYEQRCATRTQYTTDEHVSGYDVSYRYNGRIYQTVTDYHPGDSIRVRVDVSAAH